ncbi:MAG: lantibiotic dehydratase, partial [Peptidiphaga gingivicola]
MEGSFSPLAAARHFTLRTAARPLRLAPAENDVLLAAAGREGLVEYIRDAYRDPAFAQAVVHAAPALWESVQRALGDPASMKPNRLRRVALSTRKFLNRISSRPTPFGLFAGVSVGEFAGDPEDSRVRFTQGRREAVADFRWLSPVVRSLEQRLEVLKGLTVRRNPLLRWRANEILVFGADRADVSQSRTAIGRTPVLD